MNCGKLTPSRRSDEERNRLVEENQGLIRHAFRVVSKGSTGMFSFLGTVDDVMQFGNIHLMRAAELWDETENVAFSTYAMRSIIFALVGAYNKKRPPITLSIHNKIKDTAGDDQIRALEAFIPSRERRPDSKVIAKEDRERLGEWMSQLTPVEREVVTLTFLDRLSDRDIAASIGVEHFRNIKTIRNRAMRRLRVYAGAK